MVTTRPERGPRLATSEWIRSEVDGPGALAAVSGTLPVGWYRSRSSRSIRLYRHTSSFSVGRGDEAKVAAAAARRRWSQGSPGRAAADSGVNVDRAGTSRDARPGITSLVTHPTCRSGSSRPGATGGSGTETTARPPTYARAMTPSPDITRPASPPTSCPSRRTARWPPCGWTVPRSATPWAPTSGPTFPGPWPPSAADPEVRVVVVAARGPHFSVGLDLVAMSGLAGGARIRRRQPDRRWRPGPGRPGLRSSACRLP